MNLKKICFCTLIGVLSLPVFAQNTDGGATKLLQTTAAQYQKYSTIRFNYTLKESQDNKTRQTTQGAMTIKGSKYNATYKDNRFLCDGLSMWNYNKTTNELSIYEYDPTENFIMNPQKMLSDWEQDFRAKYIRDEFQNDISISLIDLTPKVNQEYYKIRLFINKANHRIMRIAVYGKDNSIFTYHIEQFIVNEPVADNYFVFDMSKHPGVEVNDMR